MQVEKPDEATIKAVTEKALKHVKEFHQADAEYLKSIKEKADGESLGKTNARVKKQLKEMGFTDAELKDKDIDTMLGMAKGKLDTLQAEQGGKDETVKSLQQAQKDLLKLRNETDEKVATFAKEKEELETGFKTQLKARDIDSRLSTTLSTLKFNIAIEDAQLLVRNRLQKRGINLDLDAKNNIIMVTQDGGKILAKNGKEHINPTDIKALILEEADDLLAKANSNNNTNGITTPANDSKTIHHNYEKAIQANQ
jgi:hypothetical protein